MTEDKPLSKWETVLTAGLILIVLGSILYFLFHGWSSYNANERGAREEEKEDLSNDTSVLWLSIKKDLAKKPQIKIEPQLIEFQFQASAKHSMIIYKFLPRGESDGKIYRTTIDRNGFEEGISLLNKVSGFKVIEGGNVIKLTAERISSKNSGKQKFTSCIELSREKDEYIISPADITFPHDRGRKIPLFLEIPFML